MGRNGFEAALDDCLALLRQGESIEECLQRYPELGEQLRPLLEMAVAVKSLGVEPSPDRAAAGRERFLREAVEAVDGKVPRVGWRTRVEGLVKEYGGMSMLQRVAVTAATVLVLTLFLGGTLLFVSAHELEGTVEAITTDGDDNVISLTVDGVTVNAPRGTEFDVVGVLEVGDFVTIQGEWEPDGSLTATEIEEEHADEPEIEGSEPDEGEPGESLVVVITGEGTHFDDDTLAVSFGGDITVGSIVVTSPTTLTVDITIANDAAAGDRDVRVTTGTESVTEEGAFEVEEADEGEDVGDDDDHEDGCAADDEDEEGDDEDGEDDHDDDDDDEEDGDDDDDDGAECEDEESDRDEEDDD